MLQYAANALTFHPTTWVVFLVPTVLLQITLAMTSVVPALSKASLSQILESVKSCVEMESCFLLPMSAMMGILPMEMDAAVSVWWSRAIFVKGNPIPPQMSAIE